MFTMIVMIIVTALIIGCGPRDGLAHIPIGQANEKGKEMIKMSKATMSP